MKYEVTIDQVISEVITVEAKSEQEAINKAGDTMYQSNDSSFDGMPEYKFAVKRVLTKEIDHESE